MSDSTMPPSPWQSPKYTGEPWWTKDTVALVTGSNRGIGFNILRILAQKGMTTILADRDDTEAAVASLKAEGLGDLVFHHPLDVTSPSAVATLAAWVKEKFGGLDILINNAGVVAPGLDDKAAKTLMDVNYFGVRKVTDGLLPLMREGGRIINVTSRVGLYQRLRSEKLVDEFRNVVEQDSVEKVDALANRFLDDKKSEDSHKLGWVPDAAIEPIYSESKMFVSAYTVVLAKFLEASHKKISVTAFCPGLTQTAMTEGRNVIPGLQPHPVEVGIDTGVWLSFVPTEVILKNSGKIFAERTEVPYTIIPYPDPFYDHKPPSQMA